MVVDAHHHFWRYNPLEYDWIDGSMSELRRDFLPANLLAEIQAAGVDGVVSVQARQTLAETEWLLELAASNPWIKGVVGWVPLASGDVAKELFRFAAQPQFRGVRHVVQGEADPEFLLRPAFESGLRCLTQMGLVYDLLIYESQLPQATACVDRHPDQTFVLDHIAKPRIRDAAFEPWAANLRELARRPNVYCKLSGIITEANWATWTPKELRPYFDVVLDAFGPGRLLFGSDWPVCLVAGDYGRWMLTVRELVADLSPDEQAAVLGGNARRVYRLA